MFLINNCRYVKSIQGPAWHDSVVSLNGRFCPFSWICWHHFRFRFYFLRKNNFSTWKFRKLVCQNDKISPFFKLFDKDFVENDLKCFPSARGREMIIKYFLIVLILPAIGDGSNFNWENIIVKSVAKICRLDEERMRHILSLTVLFQQFAHLANTTVVLTTELH